VLDAESFDAHLTFDILRASSTVIYVYDLAKQASIFQNRRVGDVLGHPGLNKPGALGEWAHLMHPDDRQRFPEHRDRLRRIRPSEVLSWEYRLLAPDDSWRWYLSRDTLLRSDGNGKPHLIVGSASDITEQKEAEHQKDLLLGEMRHRSRNFAAVVTALAQQTRPKDPKDGLAAYDVLVARLASLFRAGDLLLGSDDRVANLESVATAAVSVVAAKASQVEIKGPEILLPEQLAGGLTLALHELATNALKYGALALPSGRIALSWHAETLGGQCFVTLRWKETGGPEVQAPTKEGFGTRLISTVIPKSRVTFDYAADGLRCGIAFPLPEMS
jgi:PAS domain S-box-containing protein